MSRARSRSSSTQTITTGAMSTCRARERRQQLVGALGAEHERQPAVGDLRRLLDRLRPDRAEVDRDPLLHRLDQQLQRLAEAGALRPAARTPRRGTPAAPRARARRARSRRTRACAPAAARTRRRASPRTPAARTRRGRAGSARRRGCPAWRRPSRSSPGCAPGSGTGPSRARSLGLRAQVAEHRDGVLTPRLGDPDRVEPLAVGLLGEARSAPRRRTRASRRGRARCASRWHPMRPMTDLKLVPTDEERLLRETVAAICANFGPAYSRERYAADEPPAELWDALASKGYLGVNIPEEWGGGGIGMSGLAAVGEEIAAAGSSLLLIVVSPAIAGSILTRHGSDEQKDRWLRGIAAGTTRLAFAITEPDAGTNSHNLSTSLERRGRQVRPARPEDLHLRRRACRRGARDRAQQAPRRLARTAVAGDRRRRRAGLLARRDPDALRRARTSSGRCTSMASSWRRTA